jgi:hypothetical protein
MSPVTLTPTNGSKPTVADQNWLRMSVRQFFTAFNWENCSPEVQEIKRIVVQENDAPLSLTLSVCHFFNAIPWEGRSIASTPTRPELSSEEMSNNSFTLEDLSGLF